MVAVNIVRRLKRCESGAEFIEMALAFPLLMLVVLGIFDFGLLFQQYEVITNAAREGARIAILPAYSTTLAAQKANAAARVNQYINNSFLSGGGPQPSVVVADPQSVVIGGVCMTTVQVTVSYQHAFPFVGGIVRYFGGSSWGAATLNGRSTMRTEIAAATCP
jgi:Flp pilus assembly protein TadG